MCAAFTHEVPVRSKRCGFRARPRRSLGEVPMAQLVREVDVAFAQWEARREGRGTLEVKRRIGRPCNPVVTAAAIEWRGLGAPAHLLAEICAKHDVTAAAVKKRLKTTGGAA